MTHSRKLLLALTHFIVFVVGFGLMAVFGARAFAERTFGTSSKRLGMQLWSFREQSTQSATERFLRAVAAAAPELGDRTARILRLRVLALRANASKQPADEAAASEACHKLGWPRCESESIHAMGALP